MCIDGLSQEWLLVGSITSDTLSGTDLRVGAAVIDATELAADSVGISEIAPGAIQTGSGALSSGSRWIVPGTAFSNTNYFVAITARNAVAGEPFAMGMGSTTAGSFSVLGSPNAGSFNWIAIAGN